MYTRPTHCRYRSGRKLNERNQICYDANEKCYCHHLISRDLITIFRSGNMFFSMTIFLLRTARVQTIHYTYRVGGLHLLFRDKRVRAIPNRTLQTKLMLIYGRLMLSLLGVKRQGHHVTRLKLIFFQNKHVFTISTNLKQNIFTKTEWSCSWQSPITGPT